MTLHDTKTGRHWPCASIADGDARAIDLGLKDYQITPAGTAPASMRETTTESRERLRYGREG